MSHTNSAKPTIAISYGFLEGRAHSAAFRKRARAAGFRIAGLQTANIVLAHSAGCWLLAGDLSPKLIVYVGLPLNMARPRGSWVRANLANFKHIPLGRNLRIRLNNTYYALRQPRRNIDIFRHPKIAQPVTFPNAQSIFIANHHDPWPTSDTMEAFMDAHRWSFISLPGAHDNVWEDPADYVTIIKHYARLLA